MRSQPHDYFFTISSGRLKINLAAARTGADMICNFSGGSAHIGAVSIAAPHEKVRTLSLAGHRDSAISHPAAAFLAREIGCAVAVIVGIHYDDISAREIDLALWMSATLTRMLALKIKDRQCSR